MGAAERRRSVRVTSLASRPPRFRGRPQANANSVFLNHDPRCRSAAKGKAPASATRPCGRLPGSSTCITGMRSSVPMMGASSVLDGSDTKRFSTHNSSMIRCWRSLRTCWGRVSKLRKIHRKYARCQNESSIKRGPMGVTTRTTPAANFSIHMTKPTWVVSLPSARALQGPPLLHRERGNGKQNRVLPGMGRPSASSWYPST